MLMGNLVEAPLAHFAEKVARTFGIFSSFESMVLLFKQTLKKSDATSSSALLTHPRKMFNHRFVQSLCIR